MTFGFFTAAHGFVFLSGLLSGITMRNKAVKYGMKAVYGAASARRKLLYQYHLITLLSLFLVSMILVQLGVIDYSYYYDQGATLANQLFEKVVLGSVLLHQPNFLDILPMYIIFFFLVPVFVRSYATNKGVIPLLISVAIYIIYLTLYTDAVQQHINNTTPLNLGFFNMLAWQFLFFIGVFLGIHSKSGRLHRLLDHRGLQATTILLVLVLLAARHLGPYVHVPQDGPAHYVLNLLNRIRPVIGFLNFLIFAHLLYIITHMARARNWFTSRPIVMLGQHSLQVYTFHVVVVFFYFLAVQAVAHHLPSVDLKYAKLVFTPFVVLSIFIPALYQQNKKTAHTVSAG
jgi:hypothetical protein